MKIDRTAQATSLSTRLVAMCLSPEAGGGFEVREVPRRSPGADEIEIAVEAASVNPIDVRRADGYGRRLLSLVGASGFPMTLGNDFAGTVMAVGKGCKGAFAVGDRVYGVKPVSRDGSHTSHLLVKGAYARAALDAASHGRNDCLERMRVSPILVPAAIPLSRSYNPCYLMPH
jgi:NADPH:quinone reductase-like Zn-dependent oxidoreductase